jgi:hypothetical protein
MHTNSHLPIRSMILVACVIFALVAFAGCSTESDGPVPPSNVGDGDWAVETATHLNLSGSDPSDTPEVSGTSRRPVLREPTESFTVGDLGIRRVTGTVFEKLLARMPDNELTRQYVRLGDVAGTLEAMGLDQMSAGSNNEERKEYYEYVLGSSYKFNLWGLLAPWPSELRDYLELVDRYPDVGFDWASVDAFASSGNSNFGAFLGSSGGGSRPINYDVAFGQFDAEETRVALTACDCDQPKVIEYEGVEYLLWGPGDGTGSIRDRHKRPLYDHIGRGPHLLVRDGEAYYSIAMGVIEEHVEVLQEKAPSLADVEGYVEAAEWIASLGIVSEMWLRTAGFTAEEVAEVNSQVSVTITENMHEQALMLPFDFAVTGAGFDGEREFAGLVIHHADSNTAEANVERMLTRLREGVARREGPGRETLWTELVDRVDIEAYGEFLVVRVYFTSQNGFAALTLPNTLLVQE